MDHPTRRKQMISVLVVATLLGTAASRRLPRKCAPGAAAPSRKTMIAPPRPGRAARP